MHTASLAASGRDRGRTRRCLSGLHREASRRRSGDITHRALDVFEACQDMAALRFVEGRFSQKPGEELVQFSKLLSRQALQLVHVDECDHVILRFVS